MVSFLIKIKAGLIILMTFHRSSKTLFFGLSFILSHNIYGFTHQLVSFASDTTIMAINKMIKVPIEGIENKCSCRAINPKRSNQIIFESDKTIIDIPKQIFVDTTGKKIKKEVEICFTRFSNSVDFILNGLNDSYYSNKRNYVLDSKASFFISAKSQGKDVFIANGKNLNIQMALNDSLKIDGTGISTQIEDSLIESFDSLVKLKNNLFYLTAPNRFSWRLKSDRRISNFISKKVFSIIQELEKKDTLKRMNNINGLLNHNLKLKFDTIWNCQNLYIYFINLNTKVYDTVTFKNRISNPMYEFTKLNLPTVPDSIIGLKSPAFIKSEENTQSRSRRNYYEFLELEIYGRWNGKNLPLKIHRKIVFKFSPQLIKDISDYRKNKRNYPYYKIDGKEIKIKSKSLLSITNRKKLESGEFVFKIKPKTLFHKEFELFKRIYWKVEDDISPKEFRQQFLNGKRYNHIRLIDNGGNFTLEFKSFNNLNSIRVTPVKIRKRKKEWFSKPTKINFEKYQEICNKREELFNYNLKNKQLIFNELYFYKTENTPNKRKQIWEKIKPLMNVNEKIMSFTDWDNYCQNNPINDRSFYYLKPKPPLNILAEFDKVCGCGNCSCLSHGGRPKDYKYTKMIKINTLGFYNLGKIMQFDGNIKINPQFITFNDSIFTVKTIWLFDARYNGAIKYDIKDEIKINPKYTLGIAVMTENGSIGWCNVINFPYDKICDNCNVVIPIQFGETKYDVKEGLLETIGY